jgi:predicted tellurium resistance membrane protein TerC
VEWLADPSAWIGFLTLAVLEIVLGIDNIIFISILSAKLPPEQQPRARRLGLGGAMLTRIALLLSISWVIGLTDPLFRAFGSEISARDLVLVAGGLFLIGKSTWEIHDKLEGSEGHASARVGASFAAVIAQIMILDVVFSLDSVITAVGMVDQVWVMIAAIAVAVGVMLVFAGPVSDFVHRHPTLTMLALAFLLLIGVLLVAEGFHHHIPKGYVYFAMAFAVFVEALNLRARRVPAEPVHLREAYVPESRPGGL